MNVFNSNGRSEPGEAANAASLPSALDESLELSPSKAGATRRSNSESSPKSISPITIFAVPKPFESSNDPSVDLIQRNAIRSWAALSPQVDVLLIGDEPGIEEAAAELGVRHAGGMKSNSSGTPLISSAFEIAHEQTSSPILVYCNSDVILLNDFVAAINRIQAAEFDDFVAFGRRIDLSVEYEIDFGDTSQVQKLLESCHSQGKQSSIACKEYFVFNRRLYNPTPPFAVGRGNWDNWMIHSAKENKIPVIDISAVSKVIHQAHDYSHTGRGRWSCYVAGGEAKENQRLAGGRHLITGSTATWLLDDFSLREIRLQRLNLAFWSDVPQFLRLMLDLMASR